MKILIVDNEKNCLFLLQYKLRNFFSNVKIVTSDEGKEALEIISKEKDFDLLITDIRMAEVDGFKIAKHFKAENKLAKVIASTALDPKSIKNSLAKNFNGFIQKPWKDFDKQLLEILKDSN